jgi:DtxR family Mn-dependent transcriptional regulator
MSGGETVTVLTESVEDYLKAIFELSRNDDATGTGQIAERLEVAPSSVSGMLRKLVNREPPLVQHHKHGAVSLTRDGRQAALRTVRRHRLIEQFLKVVLGYRWDEVHPDAERLEHVISPLFEERLARFLREPRFDPHGDPIPDGDLNLPPSRALPINSLASGRTAVVARVPSETSETLRYLEKIGLTPGARVRVIESRPADATLRIAVIPRKTHVVIGSSLGEQILVEEA